MLCLLFLQRRGITIRDIQSYGLDVDWQHVRQAIAPRVMPHPLIVTTILLLNIRKTSNVLSSFYDVSCLAPCLLLASISSCSPLASPHHCLALWLQEELLNKIKLILITEASDGRGIDITGIEETEDIEEIEEIESDNEVRCLKRSFDRRNW